MSHVTQLATAQLTAADAITIELMEANETPAAVIIHWPDKPTVLPPGRFGAAAEITARLFASAVVNLAKLNREPKGR